METRITCISGSAAARHAESILQAWNRHDPHLLRVELDRAVALTPRRPAAGAEAERRELLVGVAEQIRRLYWPEDPMVRHAEEMDLCLSLLKHLALPS